MPVKNTGQNLVQGAAVLGISMILVKILGAVFKIVLFNIIGETGSAYFNYAYNYFSPIYALAIGGLPTAIAKMIAQFHGMERYRDMRKTLRLSITLFVIIGVLGSLFMGAFAYPYAVFAGKADAFLATLLVAPSLFFLCITSAFRGYYEGLKNMRPTAVSEVVEVIAKAVFGILLALIVIYAGYSQAESGRVFGREIPNGADESAIFSIIVPYAAAAAIFGVTLSCLAGMVYMIWVYRKNGDCIPKSLLVQAPKPYPWKSIVKSLIGISIPISIGVFVLNLATFIDTVTVTNLMNKAFINHFDVINDLFGNIVPAEDFNAENFGTFLYGSYGLAFSIINLVPAFTGIFGKSALPNVVDCHQRKDVRGLRINIQSALRLSSIMAIPAGIGICVLSEPILELLYASKPAGTTIAAPAMQIMGISVIFLGILTPAFSILQALGKVYLPVLFVIGGSIIKIIVNVATISIPTININGAAYGTVACYLFVVVLSIYKIIKVSKVRINFISVFIKPLIAGLFCGGAAFISYPFLAGIVSGKLATLVSVAFAAGVYLIVLVLIRGIAKDDVNMLPKGEKIAKTLEKRNLLG